MKATLLDSTSYLLVFSITSTEGKEILYNFTTELIKSYFIFKTPLMPITPIHSPQGSAIGEAKKKYDNNLKKINDLSDEKLDCFCLYIFKNILQLHKLLINNTLKQELNIIIDDLEEQWNTQIDVTIIMFFPFYSSPTNDISIDGKIYIRKPNNSDLKIIKRYNDEAEQKSSLLQKQQFFSHYYHQLSKEQTSVLEIEIGRYTIQEIMDYYKYRGEQRFDYYIIGASRTRYYKIEEDYQLIFSMLECIYYVSFRNRINQAMSLLQFRSKFLPSIELFIKFYNVIQSSSENFKNSEYTEMFQNNLKLIYSGLFTHRIQQLRILSDRYFLIFFSGRSFRDKIVDAAILLEATITPNLMGSRIQILAARAALLLGDTFDERKEKYEFVKKVYKFRNKIVHGDKTLTTISNDEFAKLLSLVNKIVDVLLTIYNPNLYINTPKNNPKKQKGEVGWDDIFARLDLYGFDSPKSWREIVDLK
jgi:hypothetical protein